MKFGADWLAWIKEMRNPAFHAQTLERYAAESENVDLTDRLAELQCPVLIARGAQTGSLLSESAALEMGKKINQSSMLILPNSAHEIETADFSLFRDSVIHFLDKAT